MGVVPAEKSDGWSRVESKLKLMTKTDRRAEKVAKNRL